MKNTRWTILAALLLAANSVAYAQAPGAPVGDPRMMGGEFGAPTGPGAATAPGAAADSGAVTNAQTTQTTTTTTSSSGIDEAGVAVEVDPMMETTELANTGGEPVLMTLFGLSLALGAFAIRKRVSA